MKHLYWVMPLALVAACQTPGYDYSARVAPNVPEAANYRRVAVGAFEGTAGGVAEDTFAAMIAETQLDGLIWFLGHDDQGPEGVYSGAVDLVGFSNEIIYETERRCLSYGRDGGCDLDGLVETQCETETVEVAVTASLKDTATQRNVFTLTHGAEEARQVCTDVASFPDDGRDLGAWRDPYRSSSDPYDAPIGMIETATAKAARQFRQDIAPYNQTLRAEIIEKGLIPEEQNDPRFEEAVKATKRGDFLAACSRWDVLAIDFRNAPAVIHNLGACAEARDDLASAQLYYARASELALQIPGLKEKQTRPIFAALERVSGRRVDAQLIDGVDPISDPGS